MQLYTPRPRYSQLARLLLSWRLSLRTLDTARKAEELPGGDATIRAEVGLVRGQAQAQSGMHEPARSLLKEVVKATPREDIRALVALGKGLPVGPTVGSLVA